LTHPGHRKHRIVVAHLAGVVARCRKGARVIAAAPTTVRVEAGWDRSDPTAAFVNRFRVVDLSLDTDRADTAAEILRRTGVSVADAHICAVALTSSADAIVVLTSDSGDMVRASAPRGITAVRI